MSTQRPTPPSLWHRVPLLVAAVALAASAWSCESEQTGYEVAVPLIGPIQFDETSCDVSGDICTTDADCFDEDGFDVGPCTRTLTPFEPITFQVSLTPSTPSYTLPAPDTSRWVSPLSVLQNTDSNPIAITSENFSVTGGPVTLTVEPSSRNGLYLGRDEGYDPYGPGIPSIASCTFDLDDSSTAQDYSDGITTCLRDFVKQHGAPLELDVTVTSSAGPSANLLPKSGFALKQANYSVTGGDSWDTDKECEGQFSIEVLDAVGEGSDFFDLLSCNALGFSGSGSSSEQIEVFGVAGIFDGCGTWLSLGSLGSTVGERITVGPSPPRFSVTVYQGDNFTVGPDDVPVVLLPSPELFVEYLLLAASGECLLGGQPPIDVSTGEPRKGVAFVGWEHCAEEPVERTGDMEYIATGFCPVKQGSSETSEQ